MNSDIGEFC